MDDTRAGKKGNRRQGQQRGRAPSTAEAFAPFLGPRIPEQISLQAPEPIEESAVAFTLWDLLATMLWPLTPGIRITSEPWQQPRAVIDRGQPKDMRTMQQEIAKGTGWAAIWKELKTDYKFKRVALRRVFHGRLIGWLGQHPDVLAETLQKSAPGLSAATADALVRSGPGACKAPETTKMIAHGVLVTFAWVDPIVSVMDRDSELDWDVLEELAACVLFGFCLRWCQIGHHWCFADEHFRGRCADHRLPARKPRTRVRLREVRGLLAQSEPERSPDGLGRHDRKAR